MHLLIVAAGSGRRMGAKINKLLLPVAGRPVLAWTLDAAFAAESITWIGIVGQPKDKDLIMSLVSDRDKPVKWIDGGATRQESVRLGLHGLPIDAQKLLIHDGARCLIEPGLFDKSAIALSESDFDALIAAIPVTDTIKQIDSKGQIVSTPDREKLWAAQTPQGFSVFQLKQAHQIALEKAWMVTDDAALYERLGLHVFVLESSSSNIKVTTPFDLKVAEAIIKSRQLI